MSQADRVLAVNNDLPIRTAQPVHGGKVRSVYWLDEADSQRLVDSKGYDVAPGAELAVMVISDRISAFECIWQGEGGMAGVPGKVIATRDNAGANIENAEFYMGNARAYAQGIHRMADWPG